MKPMPESNNKFQPPDQQRTLPVRRAAASFNKSLQATRDDALSSASRFTSSGPACLSSGRYEAPSLNGAIALGFHFARYGAPCLTTIVRQE